MAHVVPTPWFPLIRGGKLMGIDGFVSCIHGLIGFQILCFLYIYIYVYAYGLSVLDTVMYICIYCFARVFWIKLTMQGLSITKKKIFK